MDINVVSVAFRGEEADATVAFQPKDGSGSGGMSIRYTLEKKGNRWVVKGKGSGHAGGQGGMGSGMGSGPGSGMGSGGMGGMGGAMPPGHPAVPSTPNEQKK